MAVNKISMSINYRKNKSTLASNGKYYAEVDRQKTLSTRGLAQHLKDHNCMVGRDAIMAVLIKLSECVPELVDWASSTPRYSTRRAAPPRSR